MTIRQNIFVAALFFGAVVLAHTDHQAVALLLIALASVFVLTVEKGE